MNFSNESFSFREQLKVIQSNLPRCPAVNPCNCIMTANTIRAFERWPKPHSGSRPGSWFLATALSLSLSLSLSGFHVHCSGHKLQIFAVDGQKKRARIAATAAVVGGKGSQTGRNQGWGCSPVLPDLTSKLINFAFYHNNRSQARGRGDGPINMLQASKAYAARTLWPAVWPRISFLSFSLLFSLLFLLFSVSLSFTLRASVSVSAGSKQKVELRGLGGEGKTEAINEMCSQQQFTLHYFL